MSSINRFPTFSYSQPLEYSFSHDSVFLAREAFELCQGQDFYPTTAVDLCAGCGIVGMDYLFHLRTASRPLPNRFDFIEVQEIYEDHFKENAIRLGSLQTHLHFIKKNYADSDFQNLYDLVLCNPPYFRVGQGTLSPSEFKNRCRFYIDSDFEKLIKCILNFLTPSGRAFLLLRDLKEHSWHPLEEARQIAGENWLIEKMGEIRGTDWVQIRRQNKKKPS